MTTTTTTTNTNSSSSSSGGGGGSSSGNGCSSQIVCLYLSFSILKRSKNNNSFGRRFFDIKKDILLRLDGISDKYLKITMQNIFSFEA
jgi:hypothetical protein